MKMNAKYLGMLGLFFVVIIGAVLIAGWTQRVGKTQTERETKEDGNLGVFYFQANGVGVSDFNVTYTRLVLPWAIIEKERGKFFWDAQPIRRIEQNLAKGIKVIPVIRTVGTKWAIKTPFQSCSSPPKDLETTFNKEYGYSKSYYNFISEVAKRYKGKFPIVVIENEVVAKNFWCGTMDEYLRLVATAKKAFHDINSDVKIANSGIPSLAIGVVMVKELIDQGKEEEAFEFYNAYFNQSYTRKANSIYELKKMLKTGFVQRIIKATRYLLKRLGSAVDIINIHYYESPDLFPKVVEFIKEKTGNLPLMTNELGTRYKLEEPERYKKAASDMVKKLVLSRALNLKAVMWFPFSNDRHNVVGLLKEDKRETIEIILNAFRTTMKFINQRLLSYNNLSNEIIERHSFTFPSQKINVIWTQSEKFFNIPTGCEAFDYEGNKIESEKIVVSHFPIFIVCNSSTEDTSNTHFQSQAKVAVVYESISDYRSIEALTKGQYKRTLKDVINVLKETNAKFIFRSFFRWDVIPDSPREATKVQIIEGHTYQQLKETISEIKKEIPDIIICGAIPAQKIAKKERNPISDEWIGYPRTWEMALDPEKWGINMSKKKVQCLFGKTHNWVPVDLDCSLYDPKGVVAYFPDITKPQFQELIVSWTKKQIDAGVDAIWIDLLFNQVWYMYRMTKNFRHQAVKESYEAACKIIDEIHSYGRSKGRKIYVGTWHLALYYPYPPPNIDFITLSPTAEEVRQKRLDENQWESNIKLIRQKLGNIPIIAFIDWGSTTDTALGSFSQNLTEEERREFLKKADSFFSRKGIIFAYPVHGGWMGNDAMILSYGKSKTFDSLAPEFETYEIIKELAQNKK